MMSSSASSSQAAERLRVQELLRYFQPPSAGVEGAKPRVALDTSLTAFAQLGALKLGCQRSFISLIDHETQYIIAEATRTVSLETGETEASTDDAIYLGATSLDIFWGVCPNTISVFTATDNSLNVVTEYVKANQSCYVMNDLSKVPGYETRPYVIGWPHMRYYAEVPIHSPSGLVIGSLCVVDNEPREGLDSKGIAVLKEIAHAVMDHLELVMSKVQRKRAERMIHGLGLFIDGGDSLREWWMDSEKASRTVDPNKRRLTISERADQEFGLQNQSKGNTPSITTVSAEKAYEEPGSINSNDIGGSTSALVSPSSTDPLVLLSGSPETESVLVEHLEPSASCGVRVNGHNTNTIANGSKFKNSPESQRLTGDSRQMQLNLRSEVESMLARAANLIREAVGLSGVSFFDPPVAVGRVSSYGGSVENANTLRVFESAAALDGHEIHNQTFPKGNNEMKSSAPFSIVPTDKACKVLASSTRTGSIGENASLFSLDLPEKVLQRILKKFPRGGVIEYDDRGPISHGDLELAWYQNTPRAQEYSVSGTAAASSCTESEGGDSVEAHFLRHMLPGIRSIILFPLWDSSRERMFAYNIAWTTDRNRVFQREDFAYLASFCNSITSELSRLDTLAADRAKANFISSISHELRSPLHGVLASAELLKALTKDATSIDIINTIEICGSTLLDTMENLLTFAKINDIAVTQQQKKSSSTMSSWQQSPSQPLNDLVAGIDLGILLEEVMNANISGHQFRKSLEIHSSKNFQPSVAADNLIDPEDSVMVICDVDPQMNWMLATQPGVWKRIVMNLLGNSLKYTAAGFIHVRLSQKEVVTTSQESQKGLISLSVEDSGRGISEDYMKHHLFTPFHQEDPLCPGTGLGLSIVHQLVTSINGTIDIQSEVGVGTRVEVKVTLDSILDTESHDPSTNPERKALSQWSGRRLGLVALDVYPGMYETSTKIPSKQAKRSLALKSYLARTIEKSFGLETVTVASLESESENVDILLTTESHFRTFRSATSHQRTLPLIILCSTLTLDYRTISHVNGPLIYLSQPFGPQKLRRALTSCIPYLGKKDELASHLPKPLLMHSAIHSHMKQIRQDLISSASGQLPSADSISEEALSRKQLPKVLLVEDNPINLKLLATFLKKLGYPYSTATDGLQAVETYETAHGKFDIIFMDIQMPKMDGMAASYEIRKFEQQNLLNRTPIIALTGLASADVQEQATLCGVDLFLTKPVPLKRVRAVLEAHYPSSVANG